MSEEALQFAYLAADEWNQERIAEEFQLVINKRAAELEALQAKNQELLALLSEADSRLQAYEDPNDEFFARVTKAFTCKSREKASELEALQKEKEELKFSIWSLGNSVTAYGTENEQLRAQNRELEKDKAAILKAWGVLKWKLPYSDEVVVIDKISFANDKALAQPGEK